MSPTSKTPRKMGLQQEMNDLVKSVSKFSQEFESLKNRSKELFQERETAAENLEKAKATLATSQAEYQKALHKFDEAEAGRVKAAVDIGMSLRFWSVGDQALSEPSSDKVRLNIKQFIAKKALQNSPYCIVDEFLKNESEVDSIYAAVRKFYREGGMTPGKSGGGRSGTGAIYEGFRNDVIYWASDQQLCRNPVLAPVSGFIKKLHAFLQPIVQNLDNLRSRYLERGDAMLACYPGNGAKYKCHSDNPHNNSRLLTCIFYLNPGWLWKHGGHLRMRTENISVRVKPIFNRLLIF